MIAFTVIGEAQPAGSKRAFVVNGKAVVSDANAKSRPWKTLVAQTAAQAYEGPLLDGPLFVTLKFYQPRPKSHYGTGRNADKLKPSAPRAPAQRPDALKLARGVEDALTGVVYRDDSQIVAEVLMKHYGEPARCEIKVSTYDEFRGDAA